MLKAGIVGLPNVGKSTLFNAVVANSKAQAANFPFCTIEPNIGSVSVPDIRLDVLTKLSSSLSTIPTRIEFVDIAGIVKGANKGEGLGNKFLANIREVDAIIHVVRCFEDEDVIHVAGKVNPLEDIDIINTELALSDLSQIDKRRDRLKKQIRTCNDAKAEDEILCRLISKLNEGGAIRDVLLTDEEFKLIKHLGLLSLKPIIYAANLEESELSKGNKFSDDVIKQSEKENAGCVKISAQVESELIELDEDERKDFLKGLGVDQGGLENLIKATYELLGLRTYFTTGEKETRAWTIKAGMKAPEAAGVIHTDFEKGFIRAQTINYEKLVIAESLTNAKSKGWIRSEGKDYIVNEGDIMEFLFNV
tara:strand:+ start:19350 stop:20441 length:1092 start_codon:yes stop_codon:yes gene_type:complete